MLFSYLEINDNRSESLASGMGEMKKTFVDMQSFAFIQRVITISVNFNLNEKDVPNSSYKERWSEHENSTKFKIISLSKQINYTMPNIRHANDERDAKGY